MASSFPKKKFQKKLRPQINEGQKNAKKRPRVQPEVEDDYTEEDDMHHEDDDEPEFILNKIAIGAEYPFTLDMKMVLEDASATNLNFVTVPLFHPRLRRDNNGISDKRNGCRTRSEFAIDYNEWTSFVIGTMSSWIQLNNANDRMRITAEKVLQEEYAYANHLGLQAVFMPPVSLSCSKNANYARVLRLLCHSFPLTSPQMIVRVPWQCTVPDITNTSSGDMSTTTHVTLDGWEIWDAIRHRVDHHPKVKVALELPEDLSVIKMNSDLMRWAGEPLKAIILPTSAFTISKSGKKIILSKSSKKILYWLFQFNVHVILKGNPLPDFGVDDYVDCLEKLNVTGVDGDGPFPPTLYEKFTSNYKDSLRGPLDPLHDNLDSDTYRIMEQDPVKYERYEEALEAAMKDIHDQRQVNKKANKDQKLHVLVVGPGRGPLIQSSIQAASRLNLDVDITAVEKNVNAVITLRNRFAKNKNVKIIQCDMRKVLNLPNSPIKRSSVDIIVSELLGSFGDNEASPECLDYIQEALRDDGVMIPQRYCSFIAPMSSSVMWMSARDMFHSSDARSGLDCPYVVAFHSCHIVGAAQPVFEFHHPAKNLGKEGNNTRYKSISFELQEEVTIHGLAGYFDCTLYKDIMFSTVPETHSPGMFSWFPMFIPLTRPFRAHANDSFIVDMWRCVDSEKMWYEWSLQSPLIQGVQNTFGTSFSVKL